MVDWDVVRRLSREVGLEYLESAIRPGAVATSETLNRFVRTVEDTLQGVSDEVSRYRNEVSLVQGWMEHTMDWMLGLLNSSLAQLQAYASGWDYRWVDTFSGTGWSFSDASMHDAQFGQIMPPVASDTPMLRRRSVYVTAYPSPPTPSMGGAIELDVSSLLRDEWLYPMVVPDGGLNHLWLFMELERGYSYCNNLSLALIPWGGVRIDQIWVSPGTGWTKVYQSGATSVAAGRFWWDVRQTGRAVYLGVVLRKLSALPVAIAHIQPRATTFKESGTASFDAAAALNPSFAIAQYQLSVVFPLSGGSVSTSIGGASNSVLNITVNRLQAQVPTVIGGLQLRKA